MKLQKKKDYLQNICCKVLNYLEKSKLDSSEYKYKFSIKSEKESFFALCFAKFIEYLITNKISADHDKLENKLIENIKIYEIERAKKSNIKKDKFFLQLLCFTISLLSIIKKLPNIHINRLISKLVPKDITLLLSEIGSDQGIAQSGNLSMFYAIILYYENKYIRKSVSIDLWIDFHKKKMNEYGYWGKHKKKFLFFQNGYHQYEIFNFFNIKNSEKITHNSKELILNCCDSNGHYAPFLGGHSCFDYDAVYILLYIESNASQKCLKTQKKLKILYKNILKLINSDGGYCLNKKIRPRNFKGFIDSLLFLINSKDYNQFLEKIHYFLSYQLPKNNFIKNQFSNDLFGWDESNLWDTWFRVLTLSKIEKKYYNKRKWGFIKFPGLGS